MKPLNALNKSTFAYSEMIGEIRRGIADATLASGDRLPSESELGKRYGISITTVRRGVDVLVEEGVVIRRQGSGTFIQSSPSRLEPSIGSDTIALVIPLAIRLYHPFFSEMQKGIQRELQRSGWAICDLAPEGEARVMADLTSYSIDVGHIASVIDGRRDLAGLVMGGDAAQQILPRLGRSLPAVAVDATDACPWVGYEWEAELASGLLELLLQGCRRIWVYSGMDEPFVTKRLGGKDSVLLRGVKLTWYRPAGGHRLLSEITRSAYAATKEMLEGKVLPDGILIGSDFEAQGVLDAITASSLSPDRFQIVALCSRKSQLITGLPFTRILSDGYFKGVEIARLLQEMISVPQRAPFAIQLRGQIERHG